MCDGVCLEDCDGTCFCVLKAGRKTCLSWHQYVDNQSQRKVSKTFPMIFFLKTFNSYIRSICTGILIYRTELKARRLRTKYFNAFSVMFNVGP